MALNPGFGGQKFIPQAFEKIKMLNNMIFATRSQAIIEVDGGVTLDNARTLYEVGANVLVAGNAVFSTPDPEDTILQFKGKALPVV